MIKLKCRWCYEIVDFDLGFDYNICSTCIKKLLTNSGRSMESTINLINEQIEDLKKDNIRLKGFLENNQNDIIGLQKYIIILRTLIAKEG